MQPVNSVSITRLVNTYSTLLSGDSLEPLLGPDLNVLNTRETLELMVHRCFAKAPFVIFRLRNHLLQKAAADPRIKAEILKWIDEPQLATITYLKRDLAEAHANTKEKTRLLCPTLEEIDKKIQQAAFHYFCKKKKDCTFKQIPLTPFYGHLRGKIDVVFKKAITYFWDGKERNCMLYKEKHTGIYYVVPEEGYDLYLQKGHSAGVIRELFNQCMLGHNQNKDRAMMLSSIAYAFTKTKRISLIQCDSGVTATALFMLAKNCASLILKVTQLNNELIVPLLGQDLLKINLMDLGSYSGSFNLADHILFDRQELLDQGTSLDLLTSKGLREQLLAKPKRNIVFNPSLQATKKKGKHFGNIVKTYEALRMGTNPSLSTAFPPHIPLYIPEQSPYMRYMLLRYPTIFFITLYSLIRNSKEYLVWFVRHQIFARTN